MQQKKVLVIAGPTGVGESTITYEIIKCYPIFTRLITATTRKPRLQEKQGKDYYFFTEAQFKEEIKKGNIVEYTHIISRNNYYGTYKPELEQKLKAGFNIIVNPDLIGAKYYKKHYNATTIFLMPDSINNLEERMLVRQPKITKEELKKRMDYAQYEINNEAKFYDYIVINKQDKQAETIEQIIKILKKENYLLKS